MYFGYKSVKSVPKQSPVKNKTNFDFSSRFVLFLFVNAEQKGASF